MPELDPITLNARQREAVTAPIGPVLVLAGPGTGKTRVLTERIAYLVSRRGVHPENILALTFTNKAAAELQIRLSRTLSEEAAEAVTAGTFHRFCISILREHRETVGLPPHFGIADEDLQRTLIYRAFPRLNPNESNLNNVMQNVNRLKWQRRYKPHVPMKKGDAALLDQYEAELKKNRLIDFDDLIFLAHDLLHSHRQILADYRAQFQHVLVDEFQDTDPVQYALVYLLGAAHRSVFVVADDEQSIYGWRHARPEHIEQFRDDFLKGRHPIFLEENYRSSAEILRLARVFIAKNDVLFERSIHTYKSGRRVRGMAFDTFEEEGQFIAGDIWDRIRETPDLSHRDIAVLYPQHAIGSELERIFMRANVPCLMAHRRGLFDQPVIRRALSVLRYALDGANDASLELFLRRELEAVDPKLYPAVRGFQKEKNIGSFKQAAFLYPRTVSEAEGVDVERALGLAGVVHNAVQRGAVASLSLMVDDIFDQLNTSELPSLKNHLDDVEDPLGLVGLDAVLNRVLPLWRTGGTLYVACRDEVLRHLLTTLIRDALARPGLIIREAVPGSRLDVLSDTLILSFDEDPPKTPEHFLHLGGMACGAMLAALKLCQAIRCADLPVYMPEYTAFAMETTGDDPDHAEITALGAVRVRDGRVVETFYSPVQLLRGGSTKGTHRRSLQRSEASNYAKGMGGDSHLREDVPTFQEIYLAFQAFVGIDILVAHNGYAFDFQVLHREARRNGRSRMPNPTVDILPMARSYGATATRDLRPLCERYDIMSDPNDPPALVRALALHQVFEAMKKERASRYRRMTHERLLDHVALGLLFRSRDGARDTEFSREEHVHFNLGAQRLLGPANLCIRNLVQQFPRLDADRLRGQTRMLLGEDPRPDVLALHAPDQIQRFRDLCERHGAAAPSLQEGIRNLLDFADLYKVELDTPDRDAVHLLTLHAAKGLEFREVYICGLEDRILPNARALNSADLAEQRRLLYVGITRAMDRLTLSCVRHRPGRNMAPSRFWDELGLEREGVN